MRDHRTRTWHRLALLATGLLALPLLAAAGPDRGTVSSVPRPETEEVGLAANCTFHEVDVPASAMEEQVVPAPGTGAIAEATTGDLTIFGRLCLPRVGQSDRTTAPGTVLLALHGITYDNSYWNVDFRSDGVDVNYGFSDHLTEAGYAVFAIDRLGYGSSSRPPAQQVTLDTQAAVANEVVLGLRDGTAVGIAFERVALVGHSYGSATSWLTTALHNEADAVIATGWANTIQTEPLARFFTGFQPSQVDDKFGDRNHPPGYVTPQPGSREQNFLYDLSNVDPAMIAYDYEVLRDTVTDGEGSTFYNRYGGVPLGYEPASSDELVLPLSDHVRDIRVPTFLLNGTGELFFCGADQKHCNSSQELQREEAQYFSPQACFRAAVTPNAGHDLNLQYNAAFTYDTIRTWADQVLGPDGSQYAQYRDTCQAFSGTNIDPGPGTYGPFGGPAG